MKNETADFGPMRADGTLYADNKGQEIILVDTDVKLGAPKRVEKKSALYSHMTKGHLSHNRDLNKIFYDVGEQYSGYTYQAGLGPRGRNEAGDVGGGEANHEKQQQALEILRKKDAKLSAKQLSVLEWVCVNDGSAGAWSMSQKYNKRSGIDFLKDALECLAMVWGEI